MVWLYLVVVLVLGSIGISQAGPEYDFEDKVLGTAAPGFSVSGGSSPKLSIQKEKHKGGKRSLLWEWGAIQAPAKPARLCLNLKDSNDLSNDGTNDLSIRGNELKKGGLKFWMYHGNANTKSTMKIVFDDSNRCITDDEIDKIDENPNSVEVKLDFQGWRAVWIGYAEFFAGKAAGQIKSKSVSGCTGIDPMKEGVGLDEINKVYFLITSTNQDKLYIDLVRFATEMRTQTRDMVVPSIPRVTVTGGVSTFYDEKDFWQMTLRWHKEKPTFCTNTEETPSTDETGDIKEIERRLENWYASDEQISEFDPLFTTLGTEISRSEASFKEFQYKRWKGLKKDIEEAHECLADVLDNKPSLFASRSDQGKENIKSAKTKFSLIFFKFLLPLAIDYNFKSRKNDDSEDIDDIEKLLLYIEEQGWAEGSGIGTLAHEMNKSGAGFMHSMFLLRNALKRKGLLGKLLKTMKWYTDFNEIYQKDGDYIYDGTTADRMRTTLFYRLMIILMQTNPNDQVRDMKCFKNWVNHILKVNKGFGGVIKPDYTGFHHKTFFGSAYVPQALHNAALVQYLLDGTSFALDSEAKQNLRNVLAVFRTVAVKYSTPNSLCGRFPNYDRAVLAELVPAYAYISFVHESNGSPSSVHEPEMFLRLADPLQDPVLKAYLKNGKLGKSIHYWNTIGSLDILDKVIDASKSAEPEAKTAEDSPSGHWSKNYAALSIHRRQEWSVAAKGFNRYTWDFEKTDAQNVYGLFLSHGSLQISNSEAALKAHDVHNGWDWTRIPGATTVNLNLENIRTDKARYYNPGGFAGGVAMVGSDDENLGPQNGAFGMKFKKPDYEMKTNKASPLKQMNFEFKKSYFFYDHLIVAVGSDILLEGLDKKDDFYAQTTLFQDKLVDPSKSSTIDIDSTKYDLRVLLKSWKRRTSSKVELTDTHGNKYKVKTDKNTELNVKISDQESRDPDGCVKKTKARYATAWIMHKKDNDGSQSGNQEERNEYEYAILVKDGDEELLSKYKVKRIENNKAHAVHIKTTLTTDTNNNEGVFAYSIFDQITDNSFGPVKTTDSPCMIMAKKDNEFLYLSISNPSLEFEKIDVENANLRLQNTCSGTNRKDLNSSGCVADMFHPLNSDDVRTKMMFCVKGKEKDITVTLNCDFEQEDIVSARVDSKKLEQSRVIEYAAKVQGLPAVKFLKLVDGFTTEIKIRNRQCNYEVTRQLL